MPEPAATSVALMVNIRRARPDEWAQSRDLRLEMLSDSPRSFLDKLDDVVGWPEDRWKSRLTSMSAPDSILVVAVDGDAWVGQASGRVIGSFDPPRAYVLGVYVTPSTRGMGLAGQLVGEVATWAEGLGFEDLYLDVHEDAEPAKASYVRQGFTFTGTSAEHPHYPGELELEMVKRLAH